MPFKSEAQRRYLWANEPEIARDWTDTYGSRIQKDSGGIMRLGFDKGGEVVDENNLTYEESPYSNKFTEEEFNEMFGKETIGIGEKIASGIDTLRDKFTGGVNYIKELPGMALGALSGIPLEYLMQGIRGQQLTQAQKDMNNQFFQNYNVGIGTQQNPFQMTSGPFQGMNAPGMSVMGSPTSQAMAQKWMDKYGDVDHYSDAMKQKKQTIKNIATMNQGPAGINPGSGDNMGMAQGSSSPSKPGRWHPGVKEGGLISLWPR
tara:strand:+ start:8123 stop:8905 length:783 start_codon:yes stop_codon:yes gene_type:complete